MIKELKINTRDTNQHVDVRVFDLAKRTHQIDGDSEAEHNTATLSLYDMCVALSTTTKHTPRARSPPPLPFPYFTLRPTVWWSKPVYSLRHTSCRAIRGEKRV